MSEQLEELSSNYKIPQAAIDLIQNTPVLLLVGTSGVGKDTIRRALLGTGKYHHVVSHTTRLPRENDGTAEQDGVDYHFITKEKAEEMLRQGAFVEAKMYSGNLYGTSIAEIQKAHDIDKVALSAIEVQGVAVYEAISSSVISVFILPPNRDELLQRLHARYGAKGADPADIAKRMRTGAAELREALSKPYYHFVVNEEIEQAVKAVDSIAHHNDEFTVIDHSFHVWAERLLEEFESADQLPVSGS
jgi:guanylate kinase